MAAEGGDKTEKPTGKKLKELRKKGVSPRSQELPQAVSLMVLVFALPMVMQNITKAFSGLMSATLANSGETDLAGAGQLGRAMMIAGMKALAMPVALVCASIIVTNVAFTREKPNPKLLKPKFDSLSPKKGIKRVFGPHGLVEFGKTAGKLSLMGGIGYLAFKHGITHLVNSPAPLESILFAATSTARTLLWQVAAVGMLIGLVDAGWSFRRYRKQSRMSKQEVRDESKQSEVNPEVKQAIRSKQMKLGRMRMIAAVGGADVVLTNPTHLAVALKYEPGTFAPTVVAKGAGVVAARIREKAEEAGVPVMRNVPLARALHGSCQIGDSIPIDLFRAVAEVLATVFATKRRHGHIPSPRPAADARRPAESADSPTL